MDCEPSPRHDAEVRLRSVGQVDLQARERCRARLAELTIPLGGLGRLEPILLRLSAISGRTVPSLEKPCAVIFAADHGVSGEGVSAYDAEVTEQMAVNVAMGSAMSSVLARQVGVPLQVVDVGIRTKPRHPGIAVDKVLAGTADSAQDMAMSETQAARAVHVGIERAAALASAGCDLLVAGELGIGNTTTTAALSCALLHLTPEEAVGAGTGIPDDRLRHKREIVGQILRRHEAFFNDPWKMMAAVGGLEIAAIAGSIVEAAARGIPVLLDGVTTTVAAAWAVRLNPAIRDYLLASHLSPEPAHARLLADLALEPLVSLGLRVGEGTGALFALPLLQNACRIMAQTATFTDARVTNPHVPRLENGPAADREALARAPVAPDFSPEERRAVYRVIETRRDMRVFLPDPVPEETLRRILGAAHHAPSVGYMQPWNFILVRDREILKRLHEVVDRERVKAAAHYDDDRKAYYLRLKVEGLLQAPLTICVTNSPARGGPHVLGRNTIPETDLMSTACAIENMWLAARAEGIAMGWVSMYRKGDVRNILAIPEDVDPCALLCVGYTPHFPEIPVLERVGWGSRLDLRDLVFEDVWGATANPATS